MAKNISGTPRKVTLAGITFTVFADTDITEIEGAFDRESVPTSGQNMSKMVRRSQNREGITVSTNGDELEILKELSQRTVAFPMSYETAAGDVFRSTGFIQLENRTTADMKTTIQLQPLDAWSQFVG